MILNKGSDCRKPFGNPRTSIEQFCDVKERRNVDFYGRMSKFLHALDCLPIEQSKRIIDEVEAPQPPDPRLSRKKGPGFQPARVRVARVICGRDRKNYLGIAGSQGERAHAIKRAASRYDTESAKET